MPEIEHPSLMNFSILLILSKWVYRIRSLATTAVLPGMRLRVQMRSVESGAH